MQETKKDLKDLPPKEQVLALLKISDNLLKKASEKTENKELLQKASLALIKCLTIDTKCIKAYLQLANIFKQTQNYDEALRLALNALELDKNNKTAKAFILDMKNHIIKKIKNSNNIKLKSKIEEIEKELSKQMGSTNSFNFKIKNK